MTTTIALRFPLGRFHANTWGHAVNEAVTEWPPSPWRLSRALYAAWKWRAPEIEEMDVRMALDVICDAPAYSLPRYSVGHTRHYMPDITSGKDKTFDAFVLVDPKEEILMQWQSHASSQSRAVLARLCESVSYFGRAESVADIRLCGEGEADAPELRWLYPGESETVAEPPSKVLVPLSPLDLRTLVATTTETRKARRVTPIGARWVSYPACSPDPPPPPSYARPSRVLEQRYRPKAILLRFAPSNDPHVLPAAKQAVLYGNTLHRAVIKKLKLRNLASETLSGKTSRLDPKSRDEDGKLNGRLVEPSSVLLDNHGHAHCIALDLDADRMLDSALIWAPCGLEDFELSVVSSISGLWLRRQDQQFERSFRRVRVFTESWGEPVDLVPELCKPSKKWESVTPFAPYRHVKIRRSMTEHEARETFERFLVTEVNRELLTRNLPEVREVKPVPGDWLSFRRKRRFSDSEVQGFGLSLTFDEPVEGPVALGALSHFGLGLFKPV
ncbi:MAG: type I-U CRISPR-associated protein Csb2 [Actinobacteria bacterium]|nr:type I-U CRISPR-associated protein Csb2 [Actinomycetota bacterium]